MVVLERCLPLPAEAGPAAAGGTAGVRAGVAGGEGCGERAGEGAEPDVIGGCLPLPACSVSAGMVACHADMRLLRVGDCSVPGDTGGGC